MNAKPKTAAPELPVPVTLFDPPAPDGPPSENVSIRILHSEVVALDQFVQSDGCSSRRQMMCEALEFYFSQPKEVREAFRGQIVARNGGVNIHNRMAGRRTGTRNRPKPPAQAVQPVASPVVVPKPADVAPNPVKAVRTMQKTLKTGMGDSW